MDWAILGRVAVFAVGAGLLVATLGSAVRTVILPRGIQAKLATAVFLTTRVIFRVRVGRTPSYERRDRVMAGYGPVSLLTLALVWQLATGTAYTAMFWAEGTRPLRAALTMSGSSLYTLGFQHPDTLFGTLLSFSEAALGLGLLALLISYLPTLYNAFSRREVFVAQLEVRAGSPPFGPTMIERYANIGWLGGMTSLWERWEGWFVELEETHTSFPALVFFRSPQPEHSWITAAGAMLDGAALVSSTLSEHDPDAEIMLRAGYLSLRRIADFFAIPYNASPSPTDPISVARDEFDQAYDRLKRAGIDLKPDRDQAWRDFAGWRVNYDTVLITLASLVMAPTAPWSSDRSVTSFRPTLLRSRGRRSSERANRRSDRA
ncbi:MAG: hypothetical protein M3011_12160 [Actinomycetota bacterium]|nr:hypothetical protein [Actinomycetota bacterium]